MSEDILYFINTFYIIHYTLYIKMFTQIYCSMVASQQATHHLSKHTYNIFPMSTHVRKVQKMHQDKVVNFSWLAEEWPKIWASVLSGSASLPANDLPLSQCNPNPVPLDKSQKIKWQKIKAFLSFSQFSLWLCSEFLWHKSIISLRRKLSFLQWWMNIFLCCCYIIYGWWCSICRWPWHPCDWFIATTALVNIYF